MTVDMLAGAEEMLREDVVRELAADPGVSEIEIGVAVEDGMVTLTGHVDSLQERVAAERAAKRVSGVRSVANDLLVKHLGERTDTEIAREALHGLRNNAAVPLEVKAVVSDGFVTLDGTVSWMYQRAAAENAVRHLRGVKGVSNEISVSRAPDSTTGE